jgi:hypothetical protein
MCLFLYFLRSCWASLIVFAQGQEEHLAPSHAVRFIAMRNASYKIVYRMHGSGVQELYDLTADPRTMTNVWGAPQYASVQVRGKATAVSLYASASFFAAFDCPNFAHRHRCLLICLIGWLRLLMSHQ